MHTHTYAKRFPLQKKLFLVGHYLNSRDNKKKLFDVLFGLPFFKRHFSCTLQKTMARGTRLPFSVQELPVFAFTFSLSITILAISATKVNTQPSVITDNSANASGSAILPAIESQVTSKLQEGRRYLAKTFGLHPENHTIGDLLQALKSNQTLPGANVTAVRRARQFFGNGNGFNNNGNDNLLLTLLLLDRDRGYGGYGGYGGGYSGSGGSGSGGGSGGGSSSQSNLAQTALLTLLGLALIGRMPTQG